MWSALMALVLIGVPGGAQAQVDISGQLDLVATAARDSLGLNRNIRGDGAFNPIRLKLFVRRWVNERVGLFGELLLDADASPRVNGAYVVVNELGGKDWLNTRLGLAPSIVGSFGMRSTYFNANPLIGVPLIWQYKTNLPNDRPITVDELVAGKGEWGGGAPMLYESCWLIQWELLGEIGAFEYSIGVSPGALSNPVYARKYDGSQFMGRLGVVPLQGLRIGVSGAHGPYLGPSTSGPQTYDVDPITQDQSVVGLDVEYARGRLLFHSEVFGGRWEAPEITEDLETVGGYVEGRFDFLPGWYLAGPFDWMSFSDVAVGGETPGTVAWDDNTTRTEVALGYRFSREVLIKADWQRTSFEGADNPAVNLLAIQLSTVF